MLRFNYSEIRYTMGATPKNGKRPAPKPSLDEELGLWVDSRLLNKQFSQPSQSMFQPAWPPADRLLHFADLALGSTKPDRFRALKVSKQRTKP
jgi:hypothetical protein